MKLVARFIGDPTGYVFESSLSFERWDESFAANGVPHWKEARCGIRTEPVVWVDVTKAYMVQEWP